MGLTLQGSDYGLLALPYGALNVLCGPYLAGFACGLLALPYGALTVVCRPYPTGLWLWFAGSALRDCGLLA